MDRGRDEDRGQIFSGLPDGIRERNPRPVTQSSCRWRPRMTLRLASWVILTLLAGVPGTGAAGEGWGQTLIFLY